MAKLSEMMPFDSRAPLSGRSIGCRRTLAVSMLRAMLRTVFVAEKIDHEPMPAPALSEDPYNSAVYRRQLYAYAATPPQQRSIAALFQWQLEFCGFSRELVQAVLSRTLTQRWWESLGAQNSELVDDVVGSRLANEWWYQLEVGVSTLDPSDIDAHEVYCWEAFASLVNVGLLDLIVFPDEVGHRPAVKRMGRAWLYHYLAAPCGDLYDVMDIYFDHNGADDIAVIIRAILKSPEYNNTLSVSVSRNHVQLGSSVFSEPSASSLAAQTPSTNQSNED